jgi:FMN phosphatase YigB (HAD superfamily)
VLKAFEHLGIDYPESALPLALKFDSIKKARIELFPGAIDTLRHLQRNGQKLALITNGTEWLQKEKIVRFNLEPLFDCIVI